MKYFTSRFISVLIVYVCIFMSNGNWAKAALKMLMKLIPDHKS